MSMSRRSLLSLLVLNLGIIAWAEDDPQVKPINKSLTTSDDQTLAITYFPSDLRQDAPVVVLLHAPGGNRLDWPKEFSAELQRLGFAVVIPDLRGHGQSAVEGIDVANLKPPHYQAMASADMEAIKEFVFEEHQAKSLNMNKLGIIAAESACNIALYWSAYDWQKPPHNDGVGEGRTPRGQDVKALVLISPNKNAPGLPTTPQVKLIKSPAWKVAVFVATAESDAKDKSQARGIYDLLSKPDKYAERMYFESYKSSRRGTEMLGAELKIEENIYAFLTKHVKNEKSDWRDRASKIGRPDKD